MSESDALDCVLEIDGTGFTVLRFELSEALDQVDSLHCEITDGAGGPEPAPLVGQSLDLTVTLRDGAERRRFVGTVVAAESTTTRSEEVTGTQVVARPRLFRLEHRQSSRIFQEQSAPDIAKKVLTDAGIPETDQRWSLGESYPPRIHVAQYRETDYAFVERLLSEEGIAFCVDSSSGVDQVVFTDGQPDPIEGDPELPYRPADGLTTERDAITALRHEISTVSGKAYLRDYDFERPKLELNATAEASDETEKALEIYVYPGRFTEEADGDRFAQVLLDSVRARREIVTGTANTIRLQPGRTFELADHPYAPMNREYLVLAVDVAHERHRPRGEERPLESYIRFSAIPTEATPYRPRRVPRAVCAAGAQLAVTTGPPGAEIHPDEHGRVKVLFPWDREGQPDDSSSRWIRTCQVPLGGSMLTPRVGWEVCLNFIEGDPDQPYVFGRMYNAEKPPPYSLPANKTRMAIQTATTPGGGSTNEIRMEDKAGSEEMFMNASKDSSVSAKNNATEDVGNNETRSIGANQSLAVTDSMSANIGANQSLSVGGNQTINVTTFMADDVGSHSHSIGGSRDLKAGGDHNRTVTGASTLTIGGLQVDLVAGSVDEEGLSTMTDSVGAALVELTASDRTVTVKGSRTEKAGAAKVILSSSGRSVDVGASLNHKVAGAILTQTKGGKEDSSEGDFMDIAGGAQLIKATNVSFEAETLLSVVMGGSTLTLTPASVSIAGAKVTIDGECAESGALITDN